MAYVDVDKFAEAICDFQAIDDNAADEMIWFLRTFPTVDVAPKSEIANEIISEFATLITEFVKDKGLYLVVFKNAIEYAETELKKKYTEGG